VRFIKLLWVWWFYHVIVKELHSGGFVEISRELVTGAKFLLKCVIWSSISSASKLWVLILLLNYWICVICKFILFMFYQLWTSCIVSFWVQVFLNAFTSCILLIIIVQFPVKQIFIACLFWSKSLWWLHRFSAWLTTHFRFRRIDNWQTRHLWGCRLQSLFWFFNSVHVLKNFWSIGENSLFELLWTFNVY